MLTSVVAVVAGAITDSTDPITWLQALGLGAGGTAFLGMFIWWARLIRAQVKDNKDDTAEKDAKIDKQDGIIGTLRKLQEEERQKRFAAEEKYYTEHMKVLDLQRKLEDCESRND